MFVARFVHELAAIANSLAISTSSLSGFKRQESAASRAARRPIIGGITMRNGMTWAGAGAMLAMLAACGGSQPASSETPAAAASAAFAWPASLTVVGDGYPGPGAPCRRIGESAATVDFLDDSAALVGCPSADEAAKLGGTVLTTIDGVTLVSVPNDRAAVAGEGDGQGDAMVAGTNYNATAQITCAGYKGAAASPCDAGVIRSGADGTTVEVMLADGTKRAIFFNPDGSFLSFSTAEADGTAAMPISSQRKGDVTIAKLGKETYEIPDVLITGD